MPRVPHGSVLLLGEVNAALRAVEEILKSPSTPINLAVEVPQTYFGYMVDNRRAPADLLPNSTKEEAKRTVAGLVALGASMVDTGKAPDSGIPSLYTYFGQLVAHDISFEATSRQLTHLCAQVRPLPEHEVLGHIKNLRTAELDLDCVYGDRCNRVERQDREKNKDQLKLGPISPTGFLPDGADVFHDVLRENPDPDPRNRRKDRAARIGDPRNDENVINSQLHVAFMRAHNALVKEHNQSYNQARATLRQHYQWVVLEDFLKRVADPAVVDEVRQAGYQPKYGRWQDESDFRLPLEFTAAAFRFGHSMVRESYNYNRAFTKAKLRHLANPLEGNWRRLPDTWIIDWKRFAGDGGNMARPFDTTVVEPLSHLLDDGRVPMPDEARLAVRNLLRGYILRLPTGQVVADAVAPGQRLTPDQVAAAAASDEQRDVLAQAGFLERTPLWFYILAEAAHTRAQSAGKNVDHLGPVGSRIVAEVIVALIRRSEDSILRRQDWRPTLPKKGDRFELTDILRLGGVLGD